MQHKPRFVRLYSKENEFPFYFSMNKITGNFVDIKVYISKNCEKPSEKVHDYAFEFTDK